MKKIIAWIFLVGFMVSKAGAQTGNVTVDASIDSLQIYIGEQAKITLEVSTDADKRAVLPIFTDTIIKGVEVVDVAKPDTQYLNDRKRLLIKQEYTITSFDSALYYLPPMEVKVDSQTYHSKALALKVYSIPVDTVNVDQFFGPKTVMQPPFVWADHIGLIARGIFLIPFCILLAYLLVRFFDNKPIIKKVKVEPKLPPHQVAMAEIERIKQKKRWQKGEAKEYYTELTDAIRTYIADRFGFNALEMTSSEIIERLLESNDKEAISDLKELFQTADLVKFAKHSPLTNENDANLVSAIDFIKDTCVKEDETASPQPTEITVIEKRPLRIKILLGTGVVLLSAVILSFVVYIIRGVLIFFT